MSHDILCFFLSLSKTPLLTRFFPQISQPGNLALTMDTRTPWFLLYIHLRSWCSHTWSLLYVLHTLLYQICFHHAGFFLFKSSLPREEYDSGAVSKAKKRAKKWKKTPKETNDVYGGANGVLHGVQIWGQYLTVGTILSKLNCIW